MLDWLDQHLWAFVLLLFTPALTFAGWQAMMAVARSRLPVIHKALIVATELGIILEAKGDIEQICGWESHDLVGRNITAFIPRSQRQAHEDGMGHYRATGEGPIIGKTLALEALGPDDTLYPIWLTVFGYEKYSENVYGLMESRP